jgi:uncharacterized membrane protein YphA (DoxX/SURF4 family)
MKKLKTYSSLFLRIGLACAFLSNSLQAFLAPAEFVQLLNGSFVIHLLPVSAVTFVHFIGFSDGMVSLLLVLGVSTQYVAFYAGLWLIGVMAAFGIHDYGDILEHIAFFSIAVYLMLNGSDVCSVTKTKHKVL